MNATRKPACEFNGCDRPVKAVRLCGGHYRQHNDGECLRPLSGVALTFEQRFWSKVDKRSAHECWEWKIPNTRGYGFISVNGRGGGMKAAHRVSYELANGPIPDGHLIRHTCDNPPCCNPAHMILGDHDSNMLDMRVRERSRTTKLTASQVREIRTRLANGESRGFMADEYGVSKVNVGRIERNEIWRHVAAQ